MKKLISISQFIILLIVLPLIASPALIITWPILTISFFIILLLASQPIMNVKESKDNRSTDRNTMWLIMIMSSLGQLTGIIDWAYFQDAPLDLDIVSFMGIALMSFGIAFRIWAIRTLDKAFSATVLIKEGQELVTTGPYKWFRHPSYTGAWLLMIGDALVLHSWFSFIIMSVGMLWVYSKRIETEERTLAKAFGAAYVKHERKTWKMLPGW